MKTNRLSVKTKKIFSSFITVMIMIMLMLPFTLQAKKIPFLQSSIVPAAEGYVKINTDKNNNNIIKINIKNLAEINRLDTEMKTYVVWMITESNATTNIGRISSSNNLNVSFEAVTSFRPIKIFITAEEIETAKIPNDRIVLTTDNFWE